MRQPGLRGCGSVTGKGHDAAVEDDATVTPVDAPGGGDTAPGTGGRGAGGGGGGVAGASGSGGVDGGAGDVRPAGIQLIEGAIVTLGDQVSAGTLTLESDGFEFIDQMCSVDGTVCMTGGGLTP